jgi:NAD(P)-dependent dehydrogenase (short-subunit alcohol dehydrogenase family)
MIDAARIALVTGANKGIGLETARQLAEAGMTVLLGARDIDRGKRAASELAGRGLAVEAIQIDLDDEATIVVAASQIAESYGRLDVLVNNAGIADDTDGPPSTASVSAVRRIILTNFVGTLAVTQAMLPLLHRSKAGRIVNLSSPVGSLAINNDPSSPFHQYRLIGYAASKAAVNMLTSQLNAELQDTAIVVNSVIPGHVKTDLTHHQGNMTPEEGARMPVKYAMLRDEAVSGRFDSPEGMFPW